jgi:hypothetical protein
MVGSTFLGKNMIGSIFWVKTLLRANYGEKISLIAHSGKNQDCQHILGKKHG